MIMPSAITYKAAISACEKFQLWAHAWGLLREMQSDEHIPVGMTYTVAADSFLEGRALRLSSNCKMYRRCDTAVQPASRLQTKMSKIGMCLVFVLVLSELTIA